MCKKKKTLSDMYSLVQMSKILLSMEILMGTFAQFF